MDAHRSMLSNGCIRRLLLDRSEKEQGCILQIVNIQNTDANKMIISLTDGVDLIDALVSPHLKGNFINNLCSSLSLIKLLNYSIGRANDTKTTLIINDFSIVANTQKLYLPMRLLKQQPEIALHPIIYHHPIAIRSDEGNAVTTEASGLYGPRHLPQPFQSNVQFKSDNTRAIMTCDTTVQSNSINQANINSLKNIVAISGKENSNITSNNPREPVTSCINSSSKLSAATSVTKQPAQNHIFISNLNPYISGWAIICRIINKSSMKEYTSSFVKSGSRSSHYFTIDLRDKSGEISAVFFGEAAELWYSKLQHESVYIFSGGKIKIQDKYRSPRVNNDLQIIFGANCHIQAVANDVTIPRVTYTFISLRDAQTISNKDLPTAADIIGMVQEYSDITEIIKKDTKKVLRKREIVLADDSLVCMKLILWDVQADNFPLHIRDQDTVIITIKNARIKIYNEEKYITSDGENYLKYNDISNTSVQRLKNWLIHNYQKISKVKLVINDINYAFNRRISVSNLYKLVASTTEYTLNLIKKGQLVVLNCIITNILKTSIHPYCACNTKLNENSDQLSTCNSGHRYTCPNCNSMTDTAHSWKLMMTVNAIDSTGSIKIFLFDNDVCDKVLGITNEHSMYTSHQLLQIQQAAGIIFQPFLLKLKLVKGKVTYLRAPESHNISCVDCIHLDYERENAALIAQLRKG